LSINIDKKKLRDALKDAPRILALTGELLGSAYTIRVRGTEIPSVPSYKEKILDENDESQRQPTNYPKALYYVGTYKKTYVCWVDTTPVTWEVKIRAFNHETKSWGTTYTIVTITSDAHKGPTIGVLPNGKLIVFYGAHSTTPLYYKISTNAEDESAWGSAQNHPIINMGWTYPQPCSFSAKLVLFCRDSVNATQTRWMKNTTTDGSTWTGWVEVLNWGNGYAPYMVFRKLGSNILMSGHNYTYATTYSENLYFAYSPDEGVTWKKADGTTITLTEALTKIATIDYHNSWTFSLLDKDGKPVVISCYEHVAGVRKLYLSQYSAALGSSGTWSTAFVTNSSGVDYEFEGGHTYPYLEDDIIQFWRGNIADSMVTRFERIDGETHKFRAAATSVEVDTFFSDAVSEFPLNT